MERKFQHLENKTETNSSVYIEELLEKSFDLESLSKANEGHNGIILELDLGRFSAKEKREFCDYFQIPFGEDEEIAIKMLKIYRAGEAEKEFTAQERAARAINDQESLRNKVSIPECYFGGEMTIASETLKKKFEANGINIKSERLGMIMMDFIKGEDLGVFCYKKFIKIKFNEYRKIVGIDKGREIKPEEYDLYLNGKSVDDLVLICHQILGIKAKYPYSDNSIEAQRERNDIANKILTPIENQGLFDKQKVADLREAITVMHNKGVVHRDLHPRNIILTEGGELAIVDFGSAVLVDDYKTADLESLYQAVGGEIMQKDESILVFLTKLAVTPEELTEKKSELNLDLALRVKKMVWGALNKKTLNAAEKKALTAWKKLQKNLETDNNLSEAIKNFSYDFGQFSGDQMLDYQIAGLMLLAETGQSELVRNFCLTAGNQENDNPVFLTKIKSLLTIL